MLKTATIFKDFKIAANADNTAVTFYKNGGKSIKVKNDNFSEQVQILDNDGLTDLFDYKYITFDDSAVFEITDCIKNGNYTTLFIQYLSNISFDTPDNNFMVDGVSVATLQRLGLDINQFAEVLNSSLNIDYVNYSALDIETQAPFMFGVKLRFSELPQDLNYRFTGTSGNVTPVTGVLNVGSRVFNPSIANINVQPTELNRETSQDNAKTVIIPMPNSLLTVLYFGSPAGVYAFQLSAFVNTLSEIITDLTLTAEIIYISSKTIILDHNEALKNIKVNNGSLELPTDLGEDLDKFLNLIRVPSGLVAEGTTRQAAPCFVMDGIFAGSYPDFTRHFFYEALDFLKIELPSAAENEAYTNVIILDNSIDISKIRNNYIYLKRESGYIRVFSDIEKNIYTDVVTTLEFAKNAYSNFDAYKKSNIELVNNQNNVTLKQQQAQKRSMQTVENVISAANTVKTSLGSWNPVAAIGGLIGGAMAIGGEEVKFNMQQQNDKANLKLSAAQALDAARFTITPSEELKGSVNLITTLKATDNTALNRGISFIVLSKVVISDMQKYMLTRYVFDNIITEKVTNISQIAKPTWQTVNNCYQVKICNRNPINTRKDLIIFVED